MAGEGAAMHRFRAAVASPLLLLLAVMPAAADEGRGYALSPIFGYDVASGPMIGGAAFVFPREGDRGLEGGLQVEVAPFNGAGALVSTSAAARRLWGDWWPRARLSFLSLPGRYYGRGMGTLPDAYVANSPRRFEGAAGIAWSPAEGLEFGADWLGAEQRDVSAAFRAAAASDEGLVGGVYSGGRIEAVHDTRDRRVASNSGHLARIWAEEWFAQAGQSSARTRMGASVSQMIPVRKSVLALHAEGAWSTGDRAYLTSFQLGGADLLRGYAPGRFRGDAMAAAAAELRRPIVSALSVALFAEAGRVWADGAPPGGTLIAADAGFSVRWALPPDRLLKLRFDIARGRDQTTTYVAFGDPF